MRRRKEGRKEMRFDHAIFLEGFLSREKEDRSKKGGYRGNRRGLINREGGGRIKVGNNVSRDVQWGKEGAATKGEAEAYDRLLNRLFVGDVHLH